MNDKKLCRLSICCFFCGISIENNMRWSNFPLEMKQIGVLVRMSVIFVVMFIFFVLFCLNVISLEIYECGWKESWIFYLVTFLFRLFSIYLEYKPPFYTFFTWLSLSFVNGRYRTKTQLKKNDPQLSLKILKFSHLK